MSMKNRSDLRAFAVVLFEQLRKAGVAIDAESEQRITGRAVNRFFDRSSYFAVQKKRKEAQREA